MKCGHCKRNDPLVTVEHVRGCDGRQSFADPAEGPFLSNKLNKIHSDLKAGIMHPLATALLDRPAPPNRRARRDATNADCREAARAVPAGRYALRNEEGEWRFYVVDKPEEGRWAGYTFLSVQASDDLHKIRGIEQRLTILLQIGVDPAQASRDYGLQLGRCGVCSKTLTNAQSLERGIGPVCAEKMGW